MSQSHSTHALFPKTATKVDFWRRFDDPTQDLALDKFTVQDVLEGRVRGFYDDKGPDNFCSVTREPPVGESDDPDVPNDGVLFIGTQPTPDRLRWYDGDALAQMLPKQKLDPDTLLSWGDVSHHSNQQIESRLRAVWPKSKLDALIANGTAHAELQKEMEAYQYRMRMGTPFDKPNDYHRSEYTLFDLNEFAIKVFTKMTALGDCPSNTMAKAICEIVFDWRLGNVVTAFTHWVQTHENTDVIMGKLNPSISIDDLRRDPNTLNTAFKVVRALVSVICPGAPLLEIVRRRQWSSLLLDFPPLYYSASVRMPNFHIKLSIVRSVSNRAGPCKLRLCIFTGHHDASLDMNLLHADPTVGADLFVQ